MNKKILTLSLSIVGGFILAGGILFSLSSCGKNNSSVDNSESSSSIVNRTYTITFIPMQNDVTVDSLTMEGNSSFTLPQPTLEGYDFLGWYTESSYRHVYTDTTFPNKNLTLYAKWGLQEYTISFDYRGNGIYDESILEYGEYINYPTPEKDGYSFVGWYENDETVFNQESMPSRDLHLVAHWEVNEYHYTYNMVEGAVNDSRNLLSYNVELSDNTLYAPTYVGYNFMGWYSDSNYQNRVYTYPLKDCTLYPKWEEFMCDLTLSSSLGDFKTTSYSCHYGEDVTLPNLEAEGYTFLGWYDESIDKLYTNNYEIKQTTNLVGRWSLDNYSITYQLNGGTAKELPSSYTVESNTKLPTPEKEGYTFEGWYLEEDFKTKLVRLDYGDLNLYALWKINTYTVSFNSNGGVRFKSIDASYNEEVKIESGIRLGYSFEGWYDEDDNLYKGSFIMPSHDVELTAKWKINTYQITLIDGDKVEELYADYQEKVHLDQLEKTGYVFEGWYDDFGIKHSEDFSMTNGNLRLTAKWSLDKHIAHYYFETTENAFDINNNLQEFSIEDSLVLAAPTKKGYEFKGWFTDSDYKNEITTLPLEDVILYAKMDIITYSITYHYSGLGISQQLVTSYNVNTDTIILPSILRDYCDFYGWYLDSNHDVKVSRINKGTVGDIDLYAHEEDYFTILQDEEGKYHITSVTDYAIEKNTGLVFVFPSSIDGREITIIDALGANNSVTQVQISQGITTLDGAFSDWTSLTSITIPTSVTTLGDFTFRNCSSLAGKMTLGSNITVIGKECFEGTSITAMDISKCTFLEEGDLMFANMKKLSELYVPSNFKSFKLGLFTTSTGIEGTGTITIKYPGTKVQFEELIPSDNTNYYFGGDNYKINVNIITSDDITMHGDRSSDVTLIIIVDGSYSTKKVTIGYDDTYKLALKSVPDDQQTTRAFHYEYAIQYTSRSNEYDSSGIVKEVDVYPYNAVITSSRVAGNLTYKVYAYYSNGQSGQDYTINYDESSEDLALPTVNPLTGYVFLGWFYDREFNNPISCIDGTYYVPRSITQDTTIYARVECIYIVALGSDYRYEIRGLSSYYIYSNYYKSEPNVAHFTSFKYGDTTVTSIGSDCSIYTNMNKIYVETYIESIKSEAFASKSQQIIEFIMADSVTSLGSSILGNNPTSVAVYYLGTRSQFEEVYSTSKYDYPPFGNSNVAVHCSDEDYNIYAY